MQFTQTHVTESEIASHLEMRLGYADSTNILSRFDPAHPEKSAAPSVMDASKDPSSKDGGASAGASGGAGTSSTTSAAASGGDAIEDPNAKGKEQIERLRTGVSTTSSGGR
jgi:hypothetical protein